MPVLYLVATPIGNMEDVTLRAVRVLKEVGLIAAEDTRKTRRLLTVHDIHTPLTSYSEKNKRTKLPNLIARLRETDVALVSDAGMPGLSDPGFELVVSAIAEGFTIVPVPGPSAVLTALVVSGLPVHRFTYLGFLPRKSGDRRRALTAVASERGTLVTFEAPHRLAHSLEDIERCLGDRRIAVCRELTKIHEEVYRGTVSAARQHFAEPRGEFTLVIEGAGENQVVPCAPEDLVGEVEVLRRGGMRLKDAVVQVAGLRGISKRTLYQAYQKAAG